MNKTYTVKQVAEMLGYSTNSIYTFLKEGRIKGVRIGKGRFRISQEELEKLLHLKKSQEIQPVSVIPLAPTSIQPASTTAESEEIKDNIPSLFDWFVSLITIIIGFTMILFVRSYEGFSNNGLSQFLIPIKTNLLIAGIGLFSINVFNRIRKNWYFIFYLIIFLNLSIFSFMLFLNKDLLGFVIFALLSLIIIFHLILNLKGIVSFIIYFGLLTILLPTALVINRSTINLPLMSFVSTWSPIQIAIVWLIVASTINGIIWRLYDKQKSLFWISLLIFDAGLVYFAYLYSAELYWGRALIFILIFLSIVISSFWHKLNFKDEEIRKTVVSIFGNLLLIFLAIITVIWVAQNNIRSYAHDELVNKLAYGKSLVESTVSSSTEKLETLSRDKLLIEAVKKNDQTNLDELTKGFFVYSTSFRRILVADENGDLLNIYPYTDIGYNNISFRDYFKNVKTSQSSYLSNLFQAQADGVKRNVISINVPILDENGNFIGIIIGSLDINFMANKLQQIANVNDGEYFILIDKNNKLIVKPNNIDKLSDKEIKELSIQNTDNVIKLDETPDFEKRLLQVRDKIDDNKWTIVIRRPLISIYNFNDSTNLLLNLAIISVGLLVIFWNVAHLKKKT